jgi:ABC-type bacteriocin/lantibiotic exporter with double-glycine peptidase domain
MLAYTNRFLAIANLTRESVKAYQENKSPNTFKQIMHFKRRLRLIKLTQVFGVVSFLICTVSMFLIMVKLITLAEILFIVSLLSLATSLTLSLVEVLISISGLKMELEKVEKER